MTNLTHLLWDYWTTNIMMSNISRT